MVEFKFQIKINYSVTFKFFNNIDEKNSKTVTEKELLSFQKGTGALIPFIFITMHDMTETKEIPATVLVKF